MHIIDSGDDATRRLIEAHKRADEIFQHLRNLSHYMNEWSAATRGVPWDVESEPSSEEDRQNRAHGVSWLVDWRQSRIEGERRLAELKAAVKLQRSRIKRTGKNAHLNELVAMCNILAANLVIGYLENQIASGDEIFRKCSVDSKGVNRISVLLDAYAKWGVSFKPA